jgi:hypothetical protein
MFHVEGAVTNSWVNCFVPTLNVIAWHPIVLSLVPVIPLAAVCVFRISELPIPGFISLKLTSQSSRSRSRPICISSMCSSLAVPTGDTYFRAVWCVFDWGSGSRILTVCVLSGPRQFWTVSTPMPIFSTKSL